MLTPEHKAALDKFTSTDHKGRPIDKAQMLKANPMIAKVLLARAMTLNDDQKAQLRQILTPSSAPVLKILLPEMTSLIDKGLGND